MQEIRVAGWTELLDALWEDAWQESLGRFRSDFAFRGRNDADEELVTSLQRLGGDARTHERHLLRNFRRYAPSEAAATPLERQPGWVRSGMIVDKPPFASSHASTIVDTPTGLVAAWFFG